MFIYLISLIVTLLTCILLIKSSAIISKPTERGLHASSTPSSAGLALLIGFSLIMIHEYTITQNIDKIFIILFTFLVTIIGLIDDIFNIQKFIRFFSQLFLSFILILLVFNIDLFNSLLIAIIFVYFINTYNFMDGIDLLATNQAIFICTSIIMHQLILESSVNYIEQFYILPITLIIILLGFYYFNFSPAKLFLGNSGSYFLGITLSIIFLDSMLNNVISIYEILILHSVFIIDTGYTIIQRFFHGIHKDLKLSKKTFISSLRDSLTLITTAHCTHNYQIMSKNFNSHLRISSYILFYNFLWCLPLSLLSAINPEFSFFIMLVCFSPYLYLCIINNAGVNND